MAAARGTSKDKRRNKLLDDMDSGSGRREPDGLWEEDPSTPLALLAVRAADARKARDVSALRVGHLTAATNYFVNMVGGSKAQISAIVKSVEDDAEEQMGRIGKRQGTAVSGWVCLDFDDVVVNVFSEEQRDFYNLDKFWGAAQFLDLSDILVPNLAPAGSERSSDGKDVDEWLLGGDDDWELDDESWELPELSISAPTPSISAPDAPKSKPFADPYADPVGQMQALAAKAKARQLAERESPPAAKQEAEAEAEEMPEVAAQGADAKTEGGEVVDWEAEAVAVELELQAAEEDDEDEGVDWEAEAVAVAREMEAEAKLDAEDEDEKEDWALGDDKLRDLVQRLEDDIDTDVEGEDEDVKIGGFQDQ